MQENTKQTEFNPEAIVCDFLSQNPSFFLSHPEIFCRLEIPRQNRDRSRSIVDCQNELLRATLTTYEMHEQEITQKALTEPTYVEFQNLFEFVLKLLEATDDATLPYIVLDQYKKIFNTHLGMIRLWNVLPNFSFLDFAGPVGQDIEQTISSMSGYYCGINEGDLVANWLQVPVDQTKSVLLVPLRRVQNEVFGFICLASSDIHHFDPFVKKGIVDKTALCAQATLKRLTR